MSDDDILASRLRDALRAEADTVTPGGDGLARIREGVDARRRPAWWRAPTIALVAAAAVVVAVVAGYTIGTSGSDQGAPPAGGVSVTPTTPTPSTSPSPSPSAAPATSTYDGVYVYYVKPEPGQGLRLYREQHDGVRSTGDRSQAALEQVLTAAPQDPDYSSLWSGRRLVSYQHDGHHATVTLSGGLPAAADVDMGVQQIVYTLSAVQPDASLKVTLVVDGAAVAGTDTRPSPRAPWLKVQGLIWVVAPAQGASVTSPVTMTFYGTANEGQINWEITRSGTVVRTGVVMGQTGVLLRLSATTTLAPGTYQLAAFEVSAKDGSRVHVDTKTFTVR